MGYATALQVVDNVRLGLGRFNRLNARGNIGVGCVEVDNECLGRTAAFGYAQAGFVGFQRDGTLVVPRLAVKTLPEVAVAKEIIIVASGVDGRRWRRR